MASVDTPRALRIAIVGGGLVGSTAYLALSKLDGVDIVIFEKAPALREAGAWISLTPSGLSVVNRIIDPSKIREIVYRGPEQGVYRTRHWRTGQILVENYSHPELGADYVQARTQRLPLLQALNANIPPDRIKYGSHVVDVHAGNSSACITLQDGLKQNFDLVVAADGLHSRVRRIFYPSHRVQARGTVAYRKNFPVELVANIPNLPDDSSAWRGNHGEVVFLSRLGLGKYGIVIIRPEQPEHAASLRWQRAIGPAGLDRLRHIYKDWDPLIGEVLQVIDDINAYPLESGPWLKDLTKDDRVVFIGDAAHPTAGAYGAGAAMGACDAWALYRSLAAARRVQTVATGHTYDLPQALRLFNETRRHFLHRVERQMSIDRIDAAFVAEASDREEEWIRRFKDRASLNHWLTEHDVELEFQNVQAQASCWSTEKQRPVVGQSEPRL